MEHKEKIIGIVGGMGPQSGLALYQSILYHTPALIDQHHLSVILMSFPGHIGDRTAFLEGEIAENPAYNIVKIITKLEQAGASIIGLACNTSYSAKIYQVILKELEDLKSQVTLLNMPVESCRYISENHPAVRRIGLMTTNGTYHSNVYKDLLEQIGYEVIIPDIKFQHEIIHRIIYDPEFGVKSNTEYITEQARSLTNIALCYFKENNAEAVILGCTELSLVISDQLVKGMLMIDSTAAMAKALIREATLTPENTDILKLIAGVQPDRLVNL